MKQFLKSAYLRCSSYLARDDGPKVIFYHDIGLSYTRMGTPFELFKDHVHMARKHGWAISAGLPSKDRELMICFDDGFRGLFEAKSYFLQENIRPTVFIAVELIGKPGYLTWGEILELQNEGFTFQSHTWSHQTLAGPMIDESPIEERTDEWFDRELRKSREFLSDRLGRPITSLCFPAGHYSDDVISRSEKAGYTHLYASFPGVMPDCSSAGLPIVFPRCLVQNLVVSDFMAVLRGGMNPLRSRYVKQHYFK